MSGSCEANGEAAVCVFTQFLCRVEEEVPGDGRRLWAEAPDHLTVFVVGVEAAEGSCGMSCQIEGRIARETCGLQTGASDAVQSVVLHSPIPAGFPRDEVAARAEQKTVRFQPPLARDHGRQRK